MWRRGARERKTGGTLKVKNKSATLIAFFKWTGKSVTFGQKPFPRPRTSGRDCGLRLSSGREREMCILVVPCVCHVCIAFCVGCLHVLPTQLRCSVRKLSPATQALSGIHSLSTFTDHSIFSAPPERVRCRVRFLRYINNEAATPLYPPYTHHLHITYPPHRIVAVFTLPRS